MAVKLLSFDEESSLNKELDTQADDNLFDMIKQMNQLEEQSKTAIESELSQNNSKIEDHHSQTEESPIINEQEIQEEPVLDTTPEPEPISKPQQKTNEEPSLDTNDNEFVEDTPKRIPPFLIWGAIFVLYNIISICVGLFIL